MAMAHPRTGIQDEKEEPGRGSSRLPRKFVEGEDGADFLKESNKAMVQITL
jgi:hypothetical protein